MENAFKIKEGGVKDGRIWRDTEEEGDDRRKKSGTEQREKQMIINRRWGEGVGVPSAGFV